MIRYSSMEEAYEAGYQKGLLDSDVRIVDGCCCVSHAKVFGLDGSIRRSKFPMAVNIEILNSDLTDGIKHLA